MAKEILTNCRVEIAAVAYSNSFMEAEISGEAEVKETTGFGDTNRTYAVGFKNWSMTLRFNHDFADNMLNEQLFSWWGTSQTVKVRKDAGAISVTNPEYSGTAIFATVPLFNANLGEVSGGSITLQGTGTLTRAVV